MENVINFPTKLVREKAAFERSLKEYISQSGLDANAQEEIIHRLGSIWEKYQYEYSVNFSFPLPSSMTSTEIEKINSSISQTFQVFIDGLKEHMHKLLIERAKFELDIYLGRLSR